MKTTNNNQNIESKNRVKNYDGEVYVKNWPTIGNVMRVKDGLVCIIFKQGGNGWYQAEDVNELPEWAVLRADIRNRETGKKAIITHIYHNYAKGRYEVKEEGQEYAKYIDVWDLADLYEPEPEQESDKANDLDEIHRQFTKGEREAEDALVRDFHGKLTKKGGTTKLTDLDTACFFAHIITAVCHEGKTMQEAYESACKDLDYMSEWRGRNLDRKVWDCLITERAFRRIEKQVSGTITWNVSYRYTENHWFAIDYTANDGETGVLVIGAETEQEAVSLAYKRHKWIAEVTGTCLAEWDGRRYHRISTTTNPDGGRKEITEAEGIKVGDTVKHNWTGDDVATVTAIRRTYWDAQDGEVYVFRLDYGQQTTGVFRSVLGPFQMEMNGGEYRREALTPCTPDGRELLPEPPKEVTISDEQSGKAERETNGEITDEPTLYERHNITAEEREALTRQVTEGRECHLSD